MFDIDIQFDDITISSIEDDDIINIQSWINYQRAFCMGKEEPLDKREFQNRFIEYYVSECEFFLKIEKDLKLIGVIRGRVEFKNPNEVWISYFLIDKSFRSEGFGTAIFQKVSTYFEESYGIYNFYTGVAQNDSRAISFWNKNNFQLQRVSKNFYNINGSNLDMLILKKIK